MSLIDFASLHGDFFRNQRCLVTGGAGFIGSHLCEALTGLGAEVTVIDDLSGGDAGNIAGLGARFVEGSILDRALLDKLAASCAYVFHQAALGSVPRSCEQPVRYHEVNATGTLNVLEAARAAKVRRVMFAASSSAYGDPPRGDAAKVETMPVLPKSPNAANKVYCEALMRAYAGSYGLDTVSLRYFNIFGPRQNANSAYAAVIAAFAKALYGGQRPVIFGDGEQSRDFTYVDNAVHANLLAARSGRPLGGAVLNVACGQRVTVNELAAQMAAILGRSELEPVHKPERAGDVKHSLADLSAAKAALGYEPVVAFDRGLAETTQWYGRTAETAETA